MTVVFSISRKDADYLIRLRKSGINDHSENIHEFIRTWSCTSEQTNFIFDIHDI